MVLHQLATLILALFFFDCETGNGTILFPFSCSLVSAIAEIHLARGVQTRFFEPTHPISPDARLTAWQNLIFVQAYGEHGLIPGLHKFLRAPKSRKFLRLSQRKRLVKQVRRRYNTRVHDNKYKGWKYNATLCFPGEGW